MVYVDDVLVIGKTFKEHLDNLREVFQRSRLAGLRLKPSCLPRLCGLQRGDCTRSDEGGSCNGISSA